MYVYSHTYMSAYKNNPVYHCSAWGPLVLPGKMRWTVLADVVYGFWHLFFRLHEAEVAQTLSSLPE